MAAAKKVDYSLFETDWLAGIKSPRTMAADYKLLTGVSVSHESIRKHFDKLGLPRNLGARVKARAEQLAQQKLSAKVDMSTSEYADRENVAIEQAALVASEVIIGQQKTSSRYLELGDKLFAELEAQTASPELFAQLGELLHAPDDKGVDKLNDIYKKIISTPGRVDSFKKLAETYKNLIALQRQSVGLSDNANGEADTPKTQTELAPNDAARRVAFILLQATKGNTP